jgi:hypothetical protein
MATAQPAMRALPEREGSVDVLRGDQQQISVSAQFVPSFRLIFALQATFQSCMR